MKILLVVVVAAQLLAACGGGAAGPTGPQGPQGEQGAQGPAGSSGGAAKSLVWVDAAGTEVNGGALPEYADPRGYVWGLDVFRASISTSTFQSIYYSGASCSGQAYISGNSPRAPFRVRGETQWRVLPDNVSPPATTSISSVMLDTCAAISSTMSLTPLNGSSIPSAAIQVPAVPYVAPLHQELR